ncbi:CopG family transcriptional regulator [Shouchella clausii]|uniref:CopG family transcriptional regulator n=1 Tax=Shouchella clausii TaxID=79880 RepID=UPI000BA5C331|nr:CopG family transcriptional regulator [Shouchella clausii]
MSAIKKGRGRPAIGETKKISVTTTADIWEKIDKQGLNRSQFFSKAAEFYLKNHDKAK